MREFVSKLLVLTICWGALFFLWDNRTTAVPSARGWLSDPYFQLQTTVTKKLTIEQRFSLSYYMPKIFPIQYACGEYLDRGLRRTFFPGDTYIKNETAPIQIFCGKDLHLSPGQTSSLSFLSGNTPTIDLNKGMVDWYAESPFFLRLSYMTVEFQPKAGPIKGAFFSHSEDRLELGPGTAMNLSIRRALLPTLQSPRFFVGVSAHPITLDIDGELSEKNPNDRLLFTAEFTRNILASEKK